MALENKEFRYLLSSAEFVKLVNCWIIDEAHLIERWGHKLRSVYRELGTLRSFGSKIPTLMCTATITDKALNDARDLLSVDADKSFHLNLGNNRANITYSVRVMTTIRNDISELDFVLPTRQEIEEGMIKARMVFFDNIKLSMLVGARLRAKLPWELRHRIQVYNSRRSRKDKERIMREITQGDIWVALCTDAAGMVCCSSLLHSRLY
jgi:superfamily II DNA helicase RecQ